MQKLTSTDEEDEVERSLSFSIDARSILFNPSWNAARQKRKTNFLQIFNPSWYLY